MRMMKGVIVLSLFHAAASAPAIVWSASKQADALHSSEEVEASSILGNVLPESADGSRLHGVVFLLGRTEDGSESLSHLASEGSLPLVQGKYDSAHCIHHNVKGIDLAPSMYSSVLSRGFNVFEVSLEEFATKLDILDAPVDEAEVSSAGGVATTSKSAGKRARLLAHANVLVVKVKSGTDPSEIDGAVVKAIEHESIDTVVLSAVRSVAEVKVERNNFYRQKFNAMQEAGRHLLAQRRRRLEDMNGQANNNGDSNNDMSGVYYVSMTPNIFAGILFTFMFAVVVSVAVTCMGMIAGQDVYVSKYPSIGREA